MVRVVLARSSGVRYREMCDLSSEKVVAFPQKTYYMARSLLNSLDGFAV